MYHIILVLIDKVEKQCLEYLCNKLQQIFSQQISIGKSIPIPADSYNPKRKQYFSSNILSRLTRLRSKDTDIILGITNKDLYVPGLNFIFGEADPVHSVAIISLARLRQELYNLPPDENIFLKRMLKEAVHELGHVFKLGHCRNPRCVMFFSNSIIDTDRKSGNFCTRCREALLKQ